MICNESADMLADNSLIDGNIQAIFDDITVEIIVECKIASERDGGEDFLKTCATISNEGPVPIGAESPSDKIIAKLMEYGEMD